MNKKNANILKIVDFSDLFFIRNIWYVKLIHFIRFHK